MKKGKVGGREIKHIDIVRVCEYCSNDNEGEVICVKVCGPTGRGCMKWKCKELCN